MTNRESIKPLPRSHSQVDHVAPPWVETNNMQLSSILPGKVNGPCDAHLEGRTTKTTGDRNVVNVIAHMVHYCTPHHLSKQGVVRAPFGESLITCYFYTASPGLLSNAHRKMLNLLAFFSAKHCTIKMFLILDENSTVRILAEAGLNYHNKFTIFSRVGISLIPYLLLFPPGFPKFNDAVL